MDTNKKSIEPELEGGDMMDVPNNDGLEDPCDTHPEQSTDTLGFGGIGPLTESEYERLAGSLENGSGEKGDGWRICAICLEEKDTDIRQHASCSCVLCELCIDVSLPKLEHLLNYYSSCI